MTFLRTPCKTSQHYTSLKPKLYLASARINCLASYHTSLYRLRSRLTQDVDGRGALFGLLDADDRVVEAVVAVDDAVPAAGLVREEAHPLLWVLHCRRDGRLGQKRWIRDDLGERLLKWKEDG